MKTSIANPGLVGLALVIFFAGGCGQGEPPPRVYDVPVQSGAEVRADLHLACSEAVASGVPVLVEFSAPWCSDCQQLHRMRQQEALAAELEYWPAVDINVGHFDRHEDLLGAFGVRSIAHWVVLEPTDCDAPVEAWARVAERKLEPASGADRSVSAEDLAGWLAGLRNS